MLNYLLRRLAMACLLTLFVSFVAYSLIFAAGDPAAAIAGSASTAADAERIRQLYGFDRPIVIQYFDWLMKVLRGDLGTSLYFGQPVSILLLDRFAMTAKIGFLGLVFALITAVPLGVVAGRWPNSIIDRVATLFAVVGQAMPSFWFALLLIIAFSIQWPILPASGVSTWQGYILPTIVLGYFSMPAIMRLTRSGMIEALRADYIRTLVRWVSPRQKSCSTMPFATLRFLLSVWHLRSLASCLLVQWWLRTYLQSTERGRLLGKVSLVQICRRFKPLFCSCRYSTSF